MEFVEVVVFADHIMILNVIYCAVDILLNFLAYFQYVSCLPEEIPIPARCPASVNECGAINPATGWKTTTMPK